MTKTLVLTALISLLTPLIAQAEAEIDPGSCEARIFLVNIHPEFEPKIRKIIEEKGYIDTFKIERRSGYHYTPPLTLMVRLNYNLSIPFSNLIYLNYVETIPLYDYQPIEDRLLFSASNWTVGKSTESACAATMELVKSLPKCVGYDSPLHK